MSDLIVHVIGLALAVGMGALGRWVYLHPERALEKFNPYGKPYGSFSIRFARIVGSAVVVRRRLWFLRRFVCIVRPTSRPCPDCGCDFGRSRQSDFLAACEINEDVTHDGLTRSCS